MPRRRRSRVYWRNGRAWGDFRDYADVGGGLKALRLGSEPYATQDPDVAADLAAKKLSEFELRRRNRALIGVERSTALGRYAEYHLVEKKRSGRFTDRWLASVEKHLTEAVQFFGVSRDLASITVRDVQRYVAVLRKKPGRRGATIQPGTIRHHLMSLSNLYRRAASEGYVAPGFNPVAALIDKPTATRKEAAFLEVHEAALLLEAARTYRETPSPFARALLRLVGKGRWEGTTGQLLKALAAARPGGSHSITGGWPDTPRGIAAHLGRLKPFLDDRGIRFEKRAGGGPTRIVLDRPDPDAPDQGRSSAAADTAGMLPFMYELLATFLLTGGRRSEVLGLRVEDISFDRKTVTFRPNEHRRLKTSSSRRVVPLWPQLEEILREYVFGGTTPLTSGLLFPGRTGGLLAEPRRPLDGIAVHGGWLAGEIRFHMLRHTYCAARLQTLDRGAPVSPFTVGRELGHGGDSLVKRVYGHLGSIRHRSEVVEYRVSQHEEQLRNQLHELRIRVSK